MVRACSSSALGRQFPQDVRGTKLWFVPSCSSMHYGEHTRQTAGSCVEDELSNQRYFSRLRGQDHLRTTSHSLASHGQPWTFATYERQQCSASWASYLLESTAVDGASGTAAGLQVLARPSIPGALLGCLPLAGPSASGAAACPRPDCGDSGPDRPAPVLFAAAAVTCTCTVHGTPSPLTCARRARAVCLSPPVPSTARE